MEERISKIENQLLKITEILITIKNILRTNRENVNLLGDMFTIHESQISEISNILSNSLVVTKKLDNR